MLFVIVVYAIITASLERSQIQNNAINNEELVRRQHEEQRLRMLNRERY